MCKTGLRGELTAEFFGTMILVLLGDGVVANVGLAPRLAPSVYTWDTICFGWAFAVVVAVYVAGGVSGAHINPAVTIALAARRGFPWGKVGPYILAQVLGGFAGALCVYLVYMEGLHAAGMPNVWSTGPGSVFGQAYWGGSEPAAVAGHYSLANASMAEFFGTMVLLWGILASGDRCNLGLPKNLSPLLVGLTVLAVGLSLGGPSGYAINPARDFGPRVFGAVAGAKGLFDGFYWLIPPVLVTCIAGIIGVFVYDQLIARCLPKSGE